MNVDAFQRSHLCRYLNREEAESLLDIGTLVHLKDGETLFQEGDPGDTLYAILEGRVEVVAQMEDGQSKTLAALEYGDVIGESALIDREPRSAAARAVQTSVLWEMTRSDLIKLIRTHPAVAAKFMWALMESLTARMRNANITQAQLMEKIKLMRRADIE